MESMLNENLIATLEQSLRQTRNAQNRLLGRLREVETESESLRQEIEAMENSAAQTEQAIYSLLATMGTSNKSWQKVSKKTQHEEDDYELQNE
jgi:septal ring factor EnvC (AmiA/AmiB activator)